MSLLPIVVAIAIGVGLGLMAWSPPPRLTMVVTTTVAAVVSIAVLALASATAIAFVLGPAQREKFVAWCRVLPLHHEVGRIEGLASLAVLGWVVLRLGIILRHRRAAKAATAGRRVTILDTERPVAYAAPGHPGCVVVSTGLLAALDPRERLVVFAHERAHLRERHDRFLLLAALADAAVPVLRPLTGRLRLAMERVADEAAVAVMGGDRQLVASAIAKAALSRADYVRTLPAFNRNGVVARVRSLTEPGPRAVERPLGTVIAVVGASLAVLATGVQAYSLGALAAHICLG